MDRRTALQSMGVFLVTIVVGLPFALRAGQWLADWPVAEPVGVSAPTSPEAELATQPTTSPEVPGEDQDPWYEPQREPWPSATAPSPTATEVGQEPTGGPGRAERHASTGGLDGADDPRRRAPLRRLIPPRVPRRRTRPSRPDPDPPHPPPPLPSLPAPRPSPSIMGISGCIDLRAPRYAHFSTPRSLIVVRE